MSSISVVTAHNNRKSRISHTLLFSDTELELVLEPTAGLMQYAVQLTGGLEQRR
uniref:Uncharacterized protein n=1 Tax=Anguilla anguilla TaxID=7936 RepID=A0A0E9XI82_ANGAN